MKIGDKVRFLNAVGGGEIVGFQDKHTVLVRDADGFDVPTLATEVVVVTTDALNFVRPGLPDRSSAPAATAAEEAPPPDLADLPVTFRPRPQERRGADALHLTLAFVPTRLQQLSQSRFEAYLINDCNYFLHCLLLRQEGDAQRLVFDGTLEPNTKLLLDEMSYDRLAEWERLTVQCLAYKTDKAFRPKPTADVALRIDTTKFYKLHAFRPSDFFESPALLFDILRDDRPVRPVNFDAEAMQQALSGAAPQPTDRPAAPAPSPAEAPEVIDLHAAELLDTTAGMTSKDILDYQLRVFRETMEAHRKDVGRRLVFIHGKGNGVLRNALLQELNKRFKTCTAQDASFREYGFGATLVTIR